MIWFAASALVWLAGGAGAFLARRNPRWATRLGAGSAVLGSLVIGAWTAYFLVSKSEARVWDMGWGWPFGGFSVGMDGLSALFLLAIAMLGTATAAYGGKYLLADPERKTQGKAWCLFNLVLLGMTCAVSARHAVLFLIGLELMSLAAAFLVWHEHEKPEVLEAGWLYLVVTHIGVAFLLPFFLVLARNAGSFEFGEISRRAAGSGTPALFWLALIGFGTKAGFMPLHVWLPAAHPAAPSHVSSLMSGVLIKIGIYGLVRSLTFLGEPQPWWGWTLVGVGATSGVLGVLFALAQHDLKRLLAYHSIENIGIIALGLGLGVLGLCAKQPVIAALGFAGGLLHVLNHALFKGLLFLGAGAVYQSAHTRNIELMGGLWKRMPWTGACFLIACVAISGLPPLNGFISEALVFGAAFTSQFAGVPSLALNGSLVLGSLALIGGLAAACFAKAFGAAFLGHARSRHAAEAQEVPFSMRHPMVFLATACAFIGLFPPLALAVVRPAVAQLLAIGGLEIGDAFLQAIRMTGFICAATWAAILLFAALAFARSRLLPRRPTAMAVTWDCGYAAPSARMQYTASSFAQPLVDLFRPVLRTAKVRTQVTALFPGSASLSTHTPDLALEGFFEPLFRGARWLLGFLRWVQHGRIQSYVLYLAITLLCLLLWKLG